MFGDIKKAARTIRYAISDAGIAAHDPATVARYRQLRREVFRPEYSFRCKPEAKLIYIEIPKAASRTLHDLLGETSSIRALGLSQFFALADDPETVIFTFTRNPFDRLASCYRNKFQDKPIHALGTYRKDLRRAFGLTLRGLKQSEPLPFDQFVELACATCISGTDGHWLQMSRLIPFGDLAPSHVGRVESFDSDLKKLTGRLGIRKDIPRLNSTASSDLWTANLRRQVSRAYEPDFQRFGYDQET